MLDVLPRIKIEFDGRTYESEDYGFVDDDFIVTTLCCKTFRFGNTKLISKTDSAFYANSVPVKFEMKED